MAGRRFSRRAYQKLLAACPEEFRREHGPQMEQAFGDLCREERYSGTTGLAKLWFRAFPDLAWTVVAERSKVVAVGNLPPWRERVGGMDLATSFMLSVFMVFAAMSLFFGFFQGYNPQQPDARLLATFVFYFSATASAAVLFSVWLTVRNEYTKATLKSVGLRRTSSGWLLVGAGAGFLGYAVESVASVLYFRVFGGTFDPFQQEQANILAQVTLLQRASLGIASVLLAFATLLLLLGMLHTYLRRWGVTAATVVGAPVFGLGLGLNPAFFFGAAFWVLLVLLYERSGSLWPPVTAYAVFGVLATVLGGLMF